MKFPVIIYRRVDMKITENNLYNPQFNLDSIYIDTVQYSILNGSLIHTFENDNKFFHRSCVFFLTGPKGNGKKLAVEAFAGSALKCGYGVYNISVNKLFRNSHDETMFEIEELISSFKEMFFRPDEKYFFILSNLWIFGNDSEAGKLFFDELYSVLDKSASQSTSHVVFAAAYDCPPDKFPDIFRGRETKIIPLSLPDSEMRSYYFKCRLEKFLSEKNDVTADFISDITEGCTYSEINAIAENILFIAKGNFLLTDDNEDDEEIQNLNDDNISFDNLVSVKEVKRIVEDIISCRSVSYGSTLRKSVYNYPNANVIAAPVSAGAYIGEHAVQKSETTNSNEIKAINIAEEMAKGPDMEQSYDSDEISELKFEELS